MENYRILVVEDEVFIAEDIRFALEDLGYEVCDICYDSESALDAVFKYRPDMVMLDINIRGTRDGIEVAGIIQQDYQIPFIYLSSLTDAQTLDRAKKTFPMGYLVKPFKKKDLLTTIEMAIFKFSSSLQQKNRDKSYIDSLLKNPLSSREYELLLDIIEGLNNSQIAKKHYISVNTVKYHVKNLFAKMDVSDRLSAVKKVVTT